MEHAYMTKLIMEIHPELLRFALKLTASQDSANDLVQDTILKALSNADRYVHEGNFKGWMCTIMYNIFANNYRRSLREPEFVHSDITDYIYQTQIVKDEWSETTFDMDLMYQVINNLPDNMKKPFKLYVFGFRYREIADKLNLPLGTIKKRLYDARKKLQNDLNGLL